MPASTQPNSHDHLASLIEKGDFSAFQSSVTSSNPSQTDLVLLMHVACSCAQRGLFLLKRIRGKKGNINFAIEIVDILLGKGVDINAQKGRGRSVIFPIVSGLSANVPAEFVSFSLSFLVPFSFPMTIKDLFYSLLDNFFALKRGEPAIKG
jgi:hypothetical protein